MAGELPEDDTAVSMEMPSARLSNWDLPRSTGWASPVSQGLHRAEAGSLPLNWRSLLSLYQTGFTLQPLQGPVWACDAQDIINMSYPENALTPLR